MLLHEATSSFTPTNSMEKQLDYIGLILLDLFKYNVYLYGVSGRTTKIRRTPIHHPLDPILTCHFFTLSRNIIVISSLFNLSQNKHPTILCGQFCLGDCDLEIPKSIYRWSILYLLIVVVIKVSIYRRQLKACRL